MSLRLLLIATIFVAAAIPAAQAQESDLFVAKSGPATAAADTDVPFTITVTNLGPDASATVTLQDVVAGGWSFISFMQNSGPTFVCSDPGTGATSGMVNCTTATMLNGETATFSIVFHIPPATPPGTSFTNIATVSSPTDPNDENNSSAAVTSTPPPPQADLGVTKSGPASATPDSDVTYTITVTNGGPDPATDATLTDTLPGTMTFVSFTQNSGPAMTCTPGATTTCTAVTFPSGGTAVFTLVGHIPPGTQSGTSFMNTATVGSKTSDPNPVNDTSNTLLTIQTADVSVTKTGPPTANAGTNVSYVITVTNGGPDAADGVSMSDDLPPGSTFFSLTQDTGPAAFCATPSAGSGGNVTCSFLSPLPNGTSAQFTLITTIGPGPTVNNTATVSSTSGDPNPNNNGSTATTTVTTLADVSITKSAPATATAGANMTYSITVANAGPSAAASVAWTDTLPAGTSFVSESQTTGPTFTCTTGATVSCNIAALASGASATFNIVVQVSPSTVSGTMIGNTASVTSPTSDPNTGNNSSTVTTTVGTLADVSISKFALAFAAAGTNLSYQITIINAISSDAANVTWMDVLSANTTFVSLTQSGGPLFTCTTGATISCNKASVATGSIADFTLVVQVSASTPTGSTISNTATVTSTTPDPNLTNNSSTAVTTVSTNADLSVTKSGPATTPSNTTATYNVSVSNAGPSAAVNVSLADNVPASMTFASATQMTGPAFSCSMPPAGGTGTITCTIASLASGASASFQFVFNVPPGVTAGTPTTNTATVTATTPDPNAANNTGTVATTIASSIPALSTAMMMLLAAVIAALALRR